MIEKLLKKINSVSMKKGRFFCDKNYKYDTIFFGCRYILDAIGDSNQIDASASKKEQYTARFVADLKLKTNASSAAANRNYILETLSLLEYANAIKKVDSETYVVIDREIIEYISVSVENAYIFQYLLAYKTYKNDKLWNSYVDYANEHNLSKKSDKLNDLANTIKGMSDSVGSTDTVWANLFVKYQILILGLANKDNFVSRTLNIKDKIIEPDDLANVEGTRSTTVKNNFYIHEFRMSYVVNTLKKYLANEKESHMPTLPKRTYKKVPLNLILYGAPGTGKTYATALLANSIIEKADKTVDELISNQSGINRAQLMAKYNQYVENGRVVFTTFHQSYGYEDFIQGLRPDTESEGIKFVPFDGVFKKIADTAVNDPSNNYVIIIDEINRANISKVLGELITLLEDDKRWGEENELSVTLPSGQVFVVPNNLYIIGTMNSADKSISLIDAALRRRFSFFEIAPEYDLITDSNLKAILKKINKSLESDLDSTDLLIGHAYFLGKTMSDLCDIMNMSIIPLLYEYYFDDKSKVKNVLSTALEGLNYDILDDGTRRLKIKKQ
ncbi:MAG: AAA family ATPase [Bacilli bacterium]|nr:AAA family ATPase [Bacilli bacterium]